MNIVYARFYLMHGNTMGAEKQRFHQKTLPQWPVLGTGSESFGSTRRATAAIRRALSSHPVDIQEVWNETPKPLFMVLVWWETVIKSRKQTKEERLVFNLDKFRKWVQPLVTIEQLKDMRERWKKHFDNAYADEVLAILQTREDEIEIKHTWRIESLDSSQVAWIKSHIEEKRIQELINKILKWEISQYINDYKNNPSWEQLWRILIDAKKAIKEKYGKRSSEHIRAKNAYKKREDVNDNTSLLTKNVIDTDHSIATTEGEHHTCNTQTETQSIPQKEEPRPQERIKESIVKRTNPNNRIAIKSDQLWLHVDKEFTIERFEQYMAGQSLKSNVNGSMAYITGERTVLFWKWDNRKMYIVKILASEEIPIPNEPLPLPKTVKIMKIFKWNNSVAKK